MPALVVLTTRAEQLVEVANNCASVVAAVAAVEVANAAWIPDGAWPNDLSFIEYPMKPPTQSAMSAMMSMYFCIVNKS